MEEIQNNAEGALEPSRRGFLKFGALAGASTIVPASSGFKLAAAKEGPSGPATPPFMVPLPVYPPKATETLSPAPTQYANRTNGECGRDPHQGWLNWPLLEDDPKTYMLRVKQGMHSFHPHLPTQAIWGYDGIFPGPTFVSYYGVPSIVRIRNELPSHLSGFGSPEISTHLHNLHAPSESDGYAGSYYSATKFGPTLTGAGQYLDHHYPNCYANYDLFDATNGDPREGLGTLWYHDHRVDFTAPNVYRGLAGFHLMFDHLDSGDENDPDPSALRLPGGVGVYDIPLVFTDLRFDSGGYLWLDQFETKGHLGNKFCVNGKIQPYFKVHPRKYRFRLLNASVSRFYEFYLTRDGVNQSFDYIANDGNLLPEPLKMNKVALGSAERGDIVLDFSKYPRGSHLFLVNRLLQKDGRGPEDEERNANGDLTATGTQILRFDVGYTEVHDPSRVPLKLREMPPLNLSEVVKKRRFKFDRESDVWTVNDKIFDPLVARITPRLGTTEIWELEGSGGWHHPVHIHMVEGRILSRNGKAPPPHERGRKDVYVLRPDEVVRVLLRFSDWTGKYMMHCHNLVHEDHAMMVRFDVVP